MWFTEVTNPGAIGRITIDGDVTEFSDGLTPDSILLGITAGCDGNMWFTGGADPGRIGRITISGEITEFTAGLTPDSQPVGIAAGPDDNLWFTQFANPGAIGKIGAGCIAPLPTPPPPISTPLAVEPRFTS